MRWMWALVLLVPAGLADAVVEDPEMDVIYDFRFTGQQIQGQDHPSIDFVEFGVGHETENTFDVWAVYRQLGSPTPTNISPGIRAEDSVFFTVGGAPYKVAWYACDDGFGRLYSLATGGSGDELGCLSGSEDIPTSTRTATVPKSMVVDSTGLPARPGTEITAAFGLTDYVLVLTPAGTLVYATDWTDEVSMTLELGPTAAGDVVLSSLTPVRASNGGPDTFVYDVTVENHGAEDWFLLSASGVPSGWQVRYPDRVRVSDTTTIPVIVTTGSGHAHGGSEMFTLEASTSQDAEAVAKLPLGIHYLDVPQLAGHHPRAWAHAIGLGTPAPGVTGEAFDIWMNTLAEVEGTDDRPAQGQTRNTRHGVGAVWQIPLDPSLMIGLDFDLNRTGTLDTVLVSDPGDSPLPATVYAYVVHCSGDTPRPVARNPSDCADGTWEDLAVADGQPVTVPVAGPLALSFDLTPTAYSDLVPHVDGNNIAIQIILVRATSPADQFAGRWPNLDTTQTLLELPLNEYQDPVDARFQSLGAVSLAPVAATQKQANPGQTVWFEFDVTSADRVRSLRLDVIGHNADWAKPQPAGAFAVSNEQARRVAVGVAVPTSAVAGEFADVFVIAEDADDPAATAVSKIRVQVVAAQVAEEAPPTVTQEAAKKSPGLSLVLVLAALGLVRRLR